MKIMFKKILNKILGKIINLEPSAKDYVEHIKKELKATREDNINIWIPSKYYNVIENQLIKDMNYDLAFLRSDNKGNVKVHVSEVVDYEAIMKRVEKRKSNKVGI